MNFTYLLLIILCLLNGINCIRKREHHHNNRHRHKKRDPHINRPENGTGTILISYENTTLDRNDQRILVVFDLYCVDNIDETDERLIAKIDHIRERYINCIDLFNLSAKHYDTANFSYVWMDLKCPLEVIQAKKNITINYDELCIEYIMYEPLFWPNQTQSTSIPIESFNTTQPTHQCSNISTDTDKSYGLDLLDSPWLDGRFTYVDKDTVVDNPDGLDIFIIDSGIQADHVEFEEGQVQHMMGNGPASLQTNFGIQYDPHGTHVAGSASGKNFGSSRGFPIYDYRVCEFDENDPQEVPCYTSLITDALDQVLKKLRDNPARRGVINLSLGGEKSFAMNDLYHSYFDKFITAGGIPVVAAGNEDQDACDVSPAYSSKAITVGAFDIERRKAWFSNWGNCVDIWGPGYDIWSAIPAENANDRYTYLSGTSMASPMIAGIVANLLVVQPTLSFDGVLQALKQNSTTVSFDKCDEYECLAPVYACGKREYGDPIPFQPDTGLLIWEIILIIIGVCLFVCVVVVVIMYVTKDKKKVKHTKIPDKDNPNVGGTTDNEEEEQAIIADTGHEQEGQNSLNNNNVTQRYAINV